MICHHLIGSLREVNTINVLVIHQIQNSITINIGKPVHLFYNHILWFLARDINQFLNRINRTVIIKGRNSDFTLVPATIHVAIHQKSNIPSLTHIQNFYPVHIVKGTCVLIVFIIKAKQIGHFVIYRIITEEPVTGYKRQNVSVIAFFHLNLISRNTKHDLIVGIYVSILPENLIHGTFIIQQIDSVRGITQPVIFLHVIQIFCFRI